MKINTNAVNAVSLLLLAATIYLLKIGMDEARGLFRYAGFFAFGVSTLLAILGCRPNKRK